MTIRTIEAPGVEIVEIDKSEYTDYRGGSSTALVTGFASQGQNYEPMQFTSKSALVNYYGEPTNEAERYFYAACSEVLNQNGKLVACKLPYDNDSTDMHVFSDYELNISAPISPISEVINFSNLASNIVDGQVESMSAIRENSNFANDLRSAFLENYSNDETLSGFVSVVISADTKKIYETLSGVFNVNDVTRYVAENGLSVPDTLAWREIDVDDTTISSLSDTYFDYDESAVISIETGKLSSYALSSKVEDNVPSSELSLWTAIDGVFPNWIEEPGFTVPLSTYNSEYKDNPQLAPQFEERQGTDNSEGFKSLIATVLSTASIDRLESYYKDAGSSPVSANINDNPYSPIREIDDTIQSYLSISFKPAGTKLDENQLDAYVVGEIKPLTNHFYIVDRLGGQYSETADGKEILGIVPVVTTAANAMYFQNIIDTSSDLIDAYSSVSGIINNENNSTTLTDSDLAIPFVGPNVNADSVSKRAADYFPPVVFLSPDQLDRENMQKIGVVVLRAYVDPGTTNKVNFDVLESFVGNLIPNSVDPATGVSTFIDKVVNSNSEYIYLFSNVEKVDADILTMAHQEAKSFGFTANQLKKDISVERLLKGLNIAFEKNEDIHERQIDYVVDAGVSNIAQFIKSVYGTGSGPYEPAGQYAKMFKLRSNEDKETWTSVIDKYNTFCAKTRKDCMFLCDGLRPFSLQGSKKIVRPTKPSNTIENSIIPNLKYLAGLNTNYGAGYCDWFQIADEFTGESFWCPPSIQAVGCNIFTDLTYNYWDAPAGMKRGVIRAMDCSFSPSIKQAGSIYNKSWNYAINYADVGLIMEGQKTLQQKKSAFDHINVRKLFLRLERQVYEIARQFVYEVNNEFTWQRFVDRVTPIFKNVLANGGIEDFKIICDETTNPPPVRSANEMRCKIGIIPSKCIDYVFIEFYNLRSGASWDEMTA